MKSAISTVNGFPYLWKNDFYENLVAKLSEGKKLIVISYIPWESFEELYDCSTFPQFFQYNITFLEENEVPTVRKSAEEFIRNSFSIKKNKRSNKIK